MSGKRKKAEPYSDAGQAIRWRKHQKKHDFGLFTPVIEGPDATKQIYAKLQRIADHIDPNLSPEAVQRLWEMLKICEGFQTRNKQGQRVQTEEQPNTLHSDRVTMAKVAQHMYKRNVQSKVKAAEQFGIHPKTFNRMIAKQSDKWTAMLVTKKDRKDRQVMQAKDKYRKAILKAGDSPPTAEQQEQAEQWSDEHPAQFNVNGH